MDDVLQRLDEEEDESEESVTSAAESKHEERRRSGHRGGSPSEVQSRHSKRSGKSKSGSDLKNPSIKSFESRRSLSKKEKASITSINGGEDHNTIDNEPAKTITQTPTTPPEAAEVPAPTAARSPKLQVATEPEDLAPPVV